MVDIKETDNIRFGLIRITYGEYTLTSSIGVEYGAMGNIKSIIGIIFRPLWKFIIVGPPFLYGWFAFIRDEFLPSDMASNLRLGGIFRMIPWYWFVIIGLSLWIILSAWKSAKHSIAGGNKTGAVLSVQSIDDKKAKSKTLKRVFAHVEYDDNKIYVLIENRESKIDITCSNIIIYEVNSLEGKRTFYELDMQGILNSVNAMGASILLPLAKVDDVLIPIEHRDKTRLNLLAINSSENQLEFKTLYQLKPLVSGLYELVLGFEVYPQREGYEKFDIYITTKINYRGGSNLELWELRNARTRK